jgi:hypothetical protein
VPPAFLGVRGRSVLWLAQALPRPPTIPTDESAAKAARRPTVGYMEIAAKVIRVIDHMRTLVRPTQQVKPPRGYAAPDKVPDVADTWRHPAALPCPSTRSKAPNCSKTAAERPTL